MYYSSRFYAQNPVFETVHEENVKVYSTKTCSCEKQYRIDERVYCAAACVTAQNI